VLHRLFREDVAEPCHKEYAPFLAMRACEGGNAVLFSPETNTLYFSILVQPHCDNPACTACATKYVQTSRTASDDEKRALLDGTFDLTKSVKRAIENSPMKQARQVKGAMAWLSSRGGKAKHEEALRNARMDRCVAMMEGDFLLVDKTPEEQKMELEAMAARVESMFSVEDE
jgi:hypothetical protein